MIIDFHIHSKYSFDCFLEPSRIIEGARRLGLEGLAITDHDTMAGVGEFKRLAPDLYIIAGQEISVKEGDILGLFLKQEIRPSRSVSEILDEIRSQGGIAVLAHPFKWPHLVRDADFLKQFDAIEVFNARNNIPVPYLENFLSRKFVRESGLSYLAGSDTHEGFELGCARTIFEFPAKGADDEAIKKAIIEKRVNVDGREVSIVREVVSHFSRNLKALKR